MSEADAPRDVRFRTCQELALVLLDRQGDTLPRAWVAGDDEMGRGSWFRQRGERFLLAVPSNTLVRDLVEDDPPYSGHGRREKVPLVRADVWRAAWSEEDWETIEVRDGEKGSLLAQVVWTLVQAKPDGRGSVPATPSHPP